MTNKSRTSCIDASSIHAACVRVNMCRFKGPLNHSPGLMCCINDIKITDIDLNLCGKRLETPAKIRPRLKCLQERTSFILYDLVFPTLLLRYLRVKSHVVSPEKCEKRERRIKSVSIFYYTLYSIFDFKYLSRKVRVFIKYLIIFIILQLCCYKPEKLPDKTVLQLSLKIFGSFIK